MSVSGFSASHNTKLQQHGFYASLVQTICLSGASTQVEVTSWQIQAAAALTHHSTQPRLASGQVQGYQGTGNLAPWRSCPSHLREAPTILYLR